MIEIAQTEIVYTKLSNWYYNCWITSTSKKIIRKVELLLILFFEAFKNNLTNS